MGEAVKDFVSPADVITVFNPATTCKAETAFSKFALNASGASAVRAKFRAQRMASSMFTLLSRFASSGLKIGRPDISIAKTRVILNMCLTICIWIPQVQWGQIFILESGILIQI